MKHVELNSNNVVVTVRSAPYPPQHPTTIEAPDEVECGWRKDGGQWVPAPPQLGTVEAYQLRAWMIRGGLDPNAVPSLIESVAPVGAERQEALMRWEYATKIPRTFALVNAVGAAMGLTPEQIDEAWPIIQRI